MISFNRYYASALTRLPPRITTAIYQQKYRNSPRTCRDFPVYYVDIPKAAGTSVVHAMGIPSPGHFLVEDLPSELQAIYRQRPCFATVRNPVSRLISIFKYAHKSANMGARSLIAPLSRYRDINNLVHDFPSEKTVRDHYFFRLSAAFIESARHAGATVSVLSVRDVNGPVREHPQAQGDAVSRVARENQSGGPSDVELRLRPESLAKVRHLYRDDYRIDALSESGLPIGSRVPKPV